MNDYRNPKHDERWERQRERRERWEKKWQEGKGGSHVFTGVILLLIGGVALAKSFYAPIPSWLFSWQMLLIAIGLLIGFKKGFRDGGWFIPIIIGVAFLLNDYVLFGDLRRHIWPMVLIVVGAVFILRPKKKRFQPAITNNPVLGTGGPGAHDFHTQSPAFDPEESVTDDFVNNTCIFSGTKKIILTKNFKGGELVNIFGGCEIDLTQADIAAVAVLDVTAIFGGATLLVPSHWAVKSEAVTIFGGISDKRKIPILQDGPKKTLVLKGTMIFGGMEINSY